MSVCVENSVEKQMGLARQVVHIISRARGCRLKDCEEVLAGRIIAVMMTQETPEESAKFLAQILANMDNVSLRFLRTMFGYYERERNTMDDPRGVEEIKAQLDLAKRITAVQMRNTPEQQAVFLARILSRLSETDREYLRIAFNFASDMTVENQSVREQVI